MAYHSIPKYTPVRKARQVQNQVFTKNVIANSYYLFLSYYKWFIANDAKPHHPGLGIRTFFHYIYKGLK